MKHALPDPRQPDFARCARLIMQTDGVLVTAGAGLGVDSGLPDFRGREGFWRAYPALGRARMGFQEIASPAAFEARPALAWGFYGHRLARYRATEPGSSFRVLHEIVRRVPAGGFVFTSNVDGQFQKAGFDPARIVECHGSIHHLQCLRACTREIWPAQAVQPEIDAEAGTLRSALPRCPRCGALARPNILMFGDDGWIADRTRAQWARLDAWRAGVERLLVIEVGAGTAVPSVRLFGEGLAAPMIRINPREAAAHAECDVALALRGGEALAGIEQALVEVGFLGG